MNIIDASPAMLALCNVGKIKQGERDQAEYNSKYPVKALRVGESFTLPYAGMKPGALQSLRSLASSNGKKLNRKFKVVIHQNYNCVEFARIA